MKQEKKEQDIEQLFANAAPHERAEFKSELRQQLLMMESEEQKDAEEEKVYKRKSFFSLFAVSTPALVAVGVLLAVLQVSPGLLRNTSIPLFAQTVSASEIAAQMTDNFAGNIEDIRYATNADGDMAVVYPTDSLDGVQLLTYSNAKSAWNTVETIELSSERTVSIDDLEMVAFKDGWIVTTVLEEAKGGDVVYSVTAVDNGGEVLESILLTNEPVLKDDAVLQVQPDEWGGVHILWKQQDGLMVRYWSAETSWYGRSMSVDSIVTPESMQMEYVHDVSDTAQGSALFFAGKNSAGYIQAALVRFVDGAYRVDFQHTLHTSLEATVLDVEAGNSGEAFVTYQNRNTVLSRRLMTNGAMTEPTELFTLADSVAFDADDMHTLFNPYGDGQYVVVWRERDGQQQTFRYRYWIPRTDWQAAEELYTASSAIAFPQLIGFTSGFVQILWEDDELYMKQYEPEKRAWSVNTVIPKEYEAVRLYTPLSYAPVRSIQGTKSLVLFQNMQTNDLQLKQWHVGTDPTQTQTLLLPSEHEYVYHTSNGQHYFVVMKIVKTLKSFIYQDDQLFQ